MLIFSNQQRMQAEKNEFAKKHEVLRLCASARVSYLEWREERENSIKIPEEKKNSSQ